MSPEEFDWYVELVQSRYHTLKLTFEQAAAVFQFEQDKDVSAPDDFSPWEELDFEYDTFQRVLTPRQLRRYQAQHAAEVEARQQELTQMDAAAAEDLPRLQRQLAFYRDELIPALYRQPLLFPFGYSEEPAKEAFVLAEYHRFLRTQKKQMLVHHYRQYRQFGPHLLQEQLLRLELQGLIPNYAAFSGAADAPTRAVMQFLFEELRSQVGHLYQDILRRHEATMIAQNRAEFVVQHGLPPEQMPGYILRPKDDPAAHLNQWTLTLLWLSRDPAAYRNLRWPAAAEPDEE